MVRKFEVGGVYSSHNIPFKGCDIPFKVTHITAGDLHAQPGDHHEKLWLRQVQDFSGDGIYQQINITCSLGDGDDEVEFAFGPGLAAFTACEFHCLHPFFPSDNSLCSAYCDSMPEWLCRFHKKIMKTFVLFFFSVKLIIIASRVKERMYTPGGIGFIAAQEDFDRVTKSQRIE